MSEYYSGIARDHHLEVRGFFQRTGLFRQIYYQEGPGKLPRHTRKALQRSDWICNSEGDGEFAGEVQKIIHKLFRSKTVPEECNFL